MITYKTNSDITLVTEGIIAHGCNTKGAFGAGVAGAIRTRWPGVYDAYTRNTRLGDELLGSCHIIRVGDDLWVANCYTQLTFGSTGRHVNIPALERSLESVFIHAFASKLTLHAPKIGSGLGGLDWDTEVLPVFEALNSEYDGVNVVIHTL
jgi:O-acetyl-ADP-ribose deacetylase (regulator of RNase III)